MLFPNDLLIRIMILVFGLCGFMVAKHIRNHKIKNKPLICPIRFDCNTVVNSDYSKFFGIPVEILGMIYYAFVALIYFFFIFIPSSMLVGLIIFPIIICLTAVLFSVYLIAVQIFILKKGCSWCVVSACISFFIFILTIFAYDFDSVAQILLSKL